MNDRPALSRRQIIQALGLAGIGTAFGPALAGCAGPGGSSAGAGAGGPTPPATGTPKGDVSFLHWRAEDKAAFAKLIDDFTAKYPGTTVTQDILPSSSYQAQALQKVQAGGAGDAFPMFRGAQVDQFAKAGVVTDLTNSDTTKLYIPSLLDAGKYNGKQVGYPYQVVLPMPIMNEDAFDKAGAEKAPKDWDGFLSTCDKLKSAGFVPMAWPGGDGNNSQLFNCMVANNAPVDDMCTQIEQGKLKCTDDWFVNMLKQYAQMAPFFQPNSAGSAVEPTEQLFASGKAAMLVTGDYHIAAVRAQGAKFPMDMIYPVTTAAGKNKYEGVYNATFVLGVNAASKVQPAAMAWVDFLSQPQNASYYANKTVQHVAVNNVEYTNEDLKKTGSWLQKKTALAAKFQFLNVDVSNAVVNSTVAVVSGTSPEKAAADAQKIVDQNLAH